MSLQLAAQHLSNHGRGKDSTLVHMSKGEVKSLNDLAMAGGGHLTINPHTGLPEAGFLSSILPMVAGFALGPAGFSLMGAGAAGLTVGGLTALATGSLSKGLMAGMGAYGGAGLGDALANAGMQEATSAEMAKAVAGGTHTPEAAAQAFGSSGFGNAALQNPALAGQQAAYSNLGAMDKIKTLGSTLGSESGRNAFMNNIGGGMGLAKYGLAAAAPTISDMMSEKEEQKTTEDKDMGQRYVYSPNKVEGPYIADPLGRERRYFDHAYTAIGADKAKSIYGFAAGGVPTATPQPGEKPSYEYDPMKQLFAKIESMPSDDQSRQAAEAQMQEQTQRGGVNQGPMTEGQQLAGQQNLARLGDFGTALTEGAAKFKQALINGDVGIIGPLVKAIAGQISARAGGAGASPGAAAAMGHGPGGMSEGSGRGRGGTSGVSGIGNAPGMASTTPGNAVSSAMGGQAAAAAAAAAAGGAKGGLTAAYTNGGSHLGDYSDGGRLLRGPGDGVSDSIPAMIGKKQPARLADGEFVVPARIVSELGNGSTEAGARKLYAMMDRIQSARRKTVGKGKVAKNSRSEKYLPA